MGGIVLQPARAPELGHMLELTHTVDNGYVAHLDGPAVIGQQVWAEAQARRWSQAAFTVVLGDGAAWIWSPSARSG